MPLVITYLIVIFTSISLASTAPTSRSLHGHSSSIPITKRPRSGLRRRQGSQSGAIGLGDTLDSEYTVQLTVGSGTLSVLFDTGSSDLWSITSACTPDSCGNSSSSTPKISSSSLTPAGVDVKLKYGDSAHQTSASGSIDSGNISLAGLQRSNQFLAAINATNTSLSDQSVSGIFGIGFPNPLIGSTVFAELIKQSLPSTNSSKPRPIDAAITDGFISALQTQGPFMSRLIADGQLKQPMFTVTLEREDIEVGGNVGQLTIGALPDGVKNESLTWVPVRLYTNDQGGLAGSTSNPNETYPARWEIPLDDVVLNGQVLAKPTLQDGYTALVDTGTSFIGGPQEVISSIYSSIATGSSNTSDGPPSMSCTAPVNLTYIIGGKSFPVDPRDILGQQDDVKSCTAESLQPTNPPRRGALMSWTLGAPFLKSNLVAFYFGNLTHPSCDPPRIGFLSTVPSNVDDQFGKDVTSAQSQGSFVETSIAAPTATFTAISTNSQGVGQAPTGVPTLSVLAKNSCRRATWASSAIAMSTLAMLCAFAL